MQYLQQDIESIWEKHNSFELHEQFPNLNNTISEILKQLNFGTLRVAEKINQQWVVNQWIKKAILLSFKFNQSQVIYSNLSNYYDKIALKFKSMHNAEFIQQGARIVPGAIARYSSYIAKDVILMPSFINVGAYIDAGTMIDTWATIGSCAQIGKNCHISGGVGVGGVLEPIQSNPVIIEDNVFIGARSEIAEGVIVEEGSVLSMGLFVSSSTKIYDRETRKIIYGRIPAYSVVVPGTLPSSDGMTSTYAAIIVKKVDAKTRNKTSLNELLRIE